MPAWGWALVWVCLSIAAIGYFVWIATGLFRSAKGVFRQLEPTLAKLEALSEALNATVEYQPGTDNLLDDPGPHIAHYARLRKAKTDEAAKRQRRLINKLIDFKPEESEINNGRT